MKIGIVENISSRMIPFAEKYLEILTENKINFEVLNVHDSVFLEKLRSLDLLIYFFPHTHTEKKWAKSLIYLAENQLGVKCFPGYNEIWHYDEKLIQTFLFQSSEFPFIKTKMFFNKKTADEWLKQAGYPLVFKLSSGAGSGAVSLIKSFNQAEKITKEIFTTGVKQTKSAMFKLEKSWFKMVIKTTEHWLRANYRKHSGTEYDKYHETQVGYAIFQEFLEGNKFDTRVNIIGGRAFAFRRRNRKNDFRASGSCIIEYNSNEIDLECIKLAFKVSEHFKFSNMAYDFLFDKDGNPVICEITYIYSAEAVFNCPGFWDKELNWHEGNFWPQYLHLCDLLKNPNLKM